ncbi:MAG TPA: hypothetical protein VMW37_03520 [Dehalococcoidales bacterium]|nr:hypothetical protein [Dehalococcoidales bacterium]
MKRIWIMVFVSLLVIFVLLDLLIVSGHVHIEFPWSHIAGFFSLFGFIGCLAIIGLAKLLGHYWLQRKEDYYNKNNGDE